MHSRSRQSGDFRSKQTRVVRGRGGERVRTGSAEEVVTGCPSVGADWNASVAVDIGERIEGRAG